MFVFLIIWRIELKIKKKTSNLTFTKITELQTKYLKLLQKVGTLNMFGRKWAKPRKKPNFEPSIWTQFNV